MHTLNLAPRRAIALRTLLALALSAIGSSVHAHVFCVSTAAQLQQALTQASTGGMYNGESNIISVVKGIYKIGTATNHGPFHYASAASGYLLVYGGYDADCTTTSWKAAQTVLDGDHDSQVLTIRSAVGEVEVDAFTIQNGESGQYGAGLAINFVAGDDSQAIIVHNIIRNNHSTTMAGGIDIGAGGSGNYLWLQNNVISGNSADQGLGAGEVHGNGGSTLVLNNTVTQNTSANGDGGDLYVFGNDIYVVNNIFWNNDSYGLYLASQGATLNYNDYGALAGHAPALSNGNVSVPPQFVNAGAGNFHLAAGSPLIAFSPYLSGGTDPDGNPAPQTGSMNVGAYNQPVP